MLSRDARFFSNVQFRADGCWFWTGPTAGAGYGALGFSDRGERYAHRWSFARFNGPIPDDAWVCHTCDQPACVNPDHLYLGDAEQNHRDMVDRSRSTAGERHPAAILTWGVVKEIRANAEETGRPRGWVRRTAKRYGVSRATVSDIITGRTWKEDHGCIQAPGA